MNTNNMKKSIYNIIISNEYGNVIVNTMTGAIVKLSNQELDYYARECAPTELTDALYESGIYIDDEIDELSLLQDIYRAAQCDKESARITICLTLECNFKCPYCYETRQKGRMGKEIQKLVLKHIEGLYQTGIEKLYVTWYGGEPLLYKDILRDMSYAIMDIAKTNGGICEFNIITNGYLIDDKTIDLFKAIHMSTIQITIDGGKEVHNKRRCLLNGEPTYDIIVTNVNSLVSNGFNVNIRVNVDKDNVTEFENVKNTFFEHDNIKCYPALVTEEKTQSKEQLDKCFSGGNYKSIIENYDVEYEKIDVKNILAPKVSMCMACHKHSYVYCYDGNVYKCINEVGRPELAVCNLCGEFVGERDNRYIKNSPFEDRICSKCAYLPLCYGRCVWQYLERKERICPDIKYVLEKIIKYKYLGKEE